MDREDIKKTLLLPKTNFPLKKIQHEETEKEIRKIWEKNQIYQRILEKNKSEKSFILHSGPTYANGKIHLGHILNYTLKDIIVRFHSFQGYYTPFLLGWDMHGLPIEHKVLQINQGKEIENLRESCDHYAKEQMNLQKEELKKLGLFTNYQQTYNTHEKEYQAKQVRFFADLVRKNLVYRGWRPIYWSCSHQTALAETEIEYLPKEDYSLYFLVSLIDEKKILDTSNVNLLIWTTQPWTIPANQLIAVKKNASYDLIKWKENYCLISSKRFSSIKWLKEAIIITKISGEQLIGLKYYRPYQNKEIREIVDGGEMVSEEEGTGILHCAPAFGYSDFLLATKAKLTIDCPLDEKGYFTQEINISEMIGKHYKEVNQLVINNLENKKKIAYQTKFTHSYPHDWRDKSPLIYRLTEQWFINVLVTKPDLIKNTEKVNWHPTWTKEKMQQFINSRDDWCISRQRKWGVPIPVLFNKKTPVLIPEIIDYIADIFAKEGSDCWFNGKILPQLTTKFPQLVNENTQLGTDIMDVWLDSGISHWCVLK